MVSCGHIFCSACVERMLEDTRCPMCKSRCDFTEVVKCTAWADAMAHNKETLTVVCPKCDTKHLRVNTEQHNRVCVDGVIGCRACGGSFTRRLRGAHRCKDMLVSKMSQANAELQELRRSHGDVCEERDLLRRQLDEYNYIHRAHSPRHRHSPPLAAVIQPRPPRQPRHEEWSGADDETEIEHDHTTEEHERVVRSMLLRGLIRGFQRQD